MFKKKQNHDEKIYDQDLVGCMGKLPVHLEFIKHRIVTPELAHMEQWYQSAYHHLSRQYDENFKKNFLQMPLHHFIYRSLQQLPLLGTLTASQDQSGRVYPFIIFRSLEHPLAKEFPSLIPWMYQAFFNATTTLCHSDWRQQQLPDLFAQINTLNQTMTQCTRRNLLEQSLQALQQISSNELIQTAADPTQNTILSSLQHYQKNYENHLVLRLPLTAGINNRVYVIFWLQLLENLLPQTSWWQIFWNDSGINHQAALTVTCKPIKTHFLNYLIDQSYKDTALINLLPFYATTNSLLTNSPNLLQLLQNWSKRLI